MLPWLIGGLVVVSMLAWRVLHTAQLDDKKRKKLPTRY